MAASEEEVIFGPPPPDCSDAGKQERFECSFGYIAISCLLVNRDLEILKLYEMSTPDSRIYYSETRVQCPLTSQRSPDGIGVDEALVDVLLERRHPAAHHLLDLDREVLGQQRLSPPDDAPVHELGQLGESLLNLKDFFTFPMGEMSADTRGKFSR